MKKWEKGFQPLHIKIEKVQKSILLYISLPRVFAMLITDIELDILSKTCFQDKYHLIRRLLDWPDIQ